MSHLLSSIHRNHIHAHICGAQFAIHNLAGLRARPPSVPHCHLAPTAGRRCRCNTTPQLSHNPQQYTGVSTVLSHRQTMNSRQQRMHGTILSCVGSRAPSRPPGPAPTGHQAPSLNPPVLHSPSTAARDGHTVPWYGVPRRDPLRSFCTCCNSPTNNTYKWQAVYCITARRATHKCEMQVYDSPETHSLLLQARIAAAGACSLHRPLPPPRPSSYPLTPPPPKRMRIAAPHALRRRAEQKCTSRDRHTSLRQTPLAQADPYSTQGATPATVLNP